MNKSTQLSLVIPVYNEEKRITNGLKNIVKFLNTQKYKWEMLLVDDGSSDKTIEIANKIIVIEKI